MSIFLALVMLSSCGPSRHAIYVEMRQPSKSGIEFAGKNIAVVHLDNGNTLGSPLSEGIADGLAYALEQDYGTGEGSVGIYRMPVTKGADYASKDTLVTLLMDTGSDVLFLIDTLAVGNMTMGGAASVASAASPDSSYISTGSLPFTVKLFCYDAMNKDDKVKAIRFLNEAGAFLVTKSTDKVAKYFGISKYTLYSYIDANKQQEEKKK